MNPKRSLILTVCVTILIIISVTLKWPLNIDFGRHNQEAKPNVAITPILNPTSNPASPPPLPSNNLNEPKMSKFPEEGVPVLMYHSISTIPGNSLGVPVKQFTEEIEWLHQQNYHSLSLEEFNQALTNKAPIPEKPILLTFDDGYEDNYSSAWPILHQNGYRATFFIVTNSVGPGMMNWDQINDLASQGNSIGSHTVHHLDLSKLSSKQQENELSISKQELVNHLDISVQALCFPSGRYNKTTPKLMSKLGYKLGFTTHPGKVHLSDDLSTLKRIRISGGMPLASFQKLFP
ncbi:polysaccharide deacetylase family protein [Desulfosporosinus sp. Sb-LF]|uniref:polysaccharide deacetylase family protein n=1 Tax=Desulfosporosinus sp. Sb-LF TaxID=2560027 RepID=UPI00107F95C0|nr:polysaccharide deacetylase family protein [Desulfosporosinus sp. Sb-LF]TGE31764.1 polysaccharide deacetylase family protein [Desulfosporosinus sp. Sb-LF]